MFRRVLSFYGSVGMQWCIRLLRLRHLKFTMPCLAGVFLIAFLFFLSFCMSVIIQF